MQEITIVGNRDSINTFDAATEIKRFSSISPVRSSTRASGYSNRYFSHSPLLLHLFEIGARYRAGKSYAFTVLVYESVFLEAFSNGPRQFLV